MISSFIFFIQKIAFGLYILSVGGILLMVYRLQRARQELAVAQFKLEREHAQVRQANAITMGGVLVEMLIGVWAIANLMAPTLEEIQLGSEADSLAGSDQDFATSTPVIGPPVSFDAGGPVNADPGIFASPTVGPTAVGTILPDAEAVTGCARDSAWIHIPGNGQLILEATMVEGIAFVSDFSYYKFEIKPAILDAQFAPIGGGYTVPVPEVGPLGNFLPYDFAPGEYRFRLTVFDNTDRLRASCEITIHIPEQQPVETPDGTSTPASP